MTKNFTKVKINPFYKNL